MDFVDSSGTLGGGPGSTGHGGALELRLNGNTQSTLALANLFAAQQPPLDPSATQGTLQFDDEVVLDRVTQAEAFQVSLLAHDGAGATSNEPGLSFTLKLGTLLFLKEGER